MRNTRRVRERFEINLESRQVALLFVLCLVILTLVFALGIIVGRGMRVPGAVTTAKLLPDEPQVPPAPAAVAEGKPAAPPREEPAPVMKFYEEGAAKPSREVKLATRPTAEDVAEQPQAGTAAKPTETKQAPSTAPKTTGQASPKPVEKSTARTEAPKTAPAVNATPPAMTKSSGEYTIQVSAFQDKAQADRMVDRLKGKGYDAFVTKAVIPGRGIWYRVRVGKYASRDAAENVAANLKRKEGIATYVTINR